MNLAEGLESMKNFGKDEIVTTIWLFEHKAEEYEGVFGDLADANIEIVDIIDATIIHGKQVLVTADVKHSNKSWKELFTYNATKFYKYVELLHKNII